ncbi:MAG: response regulator [Lachnospiraceae bacterium]|jgi:two-component system response regulator YesN|uniref:response regulator transcription factor n=1 Tax=Candidatus Merdisoma sp. JLR.KK011 TaxID=3114299 RepID=UPI00143512F7|nr:response regulator [Lachnospiraceae bacterium]MCI9252790.1 response regulator [Lachnospiraceae bacterium]MCI9384211.1 response regulator [Lachnospiraceae bacterium]MCI9479394.1 response regulator [Lachnospiraceae bacterium]MCI9622657.1 response regulator [Lachnospiraceae bacterium]
MYRVLLVEDEEIIRKGIKNSIPWEEFGCSVIGEAGNGEEGVKLIEELRPDIVITDINMPLMDGLTMLSRTKFRYDYAAVILTGYSEFEYAREAIRNGVSSYVLKPLNMEEMKEALEQAVLESKNIYYLRQRNESAGDTGTLSLLEQEREKKIQDPLVDQVLAYITANYQNKITLSDLEQNLHYSERYISQRFQKALGTTIIEYLNRYRLQKALGILKEGGIPLSEVGWECGFGEYKYFNYVFKKYMGCSAKEYQSRIR